MRPLASFDVPRRVRGLSFDVDDTLTRGGVIEASAMSALHALSTAGFALVAVTGRPLGWADVFARQWPIDLAIGENGAGWCWMDAAGAFNSAYFVDEPTRIEHQRQLERIRARAQVEVPNTRVSSDDAARRCDLAFDIGEERIASAAERAALESIILAEGARVVSSSVHDHAVPGPWDKSLGIEHAVLSLEGSFDSSEWVFVGDSGNDEAAFTRFEHSVGVANVRESQLRSWPAFVTPSDRGEGFAELAAHLVGSSATPRALASSKRAG